jgi:ABC-type polar amino acid transport system ATPase subunit
MVGKMMKNFTLPLSITLGLSKNAAREKAEQVLRKVRLWDLIKDQDTCDRLFDDVF